jgi:hypothetical protein
MPGLSQFGGNLNMRILLIFLFGLMSCATVAKETAEAAVGCIVTHEKSAAEDGKVITCFENISLERTSFESGVCQWKTDKQAAANVGTSTKFVPSCPTSYTAYCDRLVMGPGAVAPVKIFLYEKSEQVLARAKKQCLGGGGNWNTNDGETQKP